MEDTNEGEIWDIRSPEPDTKTLFPVKNVGFAHIIL
jgi:hypothetical protein